MWENLNQLLAASPIRLELVYSVSLILGVLLLRTVVLQTHFRRHPELAIENKRRWAVVEACETTAAGRWRGAAAAAAAGLEKFKPNSQSGAA